MRIECNGQPKDVAASTVEELITELGVAGQRLAVERNQTMVPRRQWAAARLQPGDRIEVVRFVGGGAPPDRRL